MAQEKKVTLALLQHPSLGALTHDDKMAYLEAMIGQGVAGGAGIILTEELFGSDYFPRVHDAVHFDLAETIPGVTFEGLSRLAKQFGVVICGSLFERAARGLYYNTTVTICEKGELRGKYRKLHIPHDPDFYEKYYFAPGDLGYQSDAVGGLALGQLICWDQWFPEAARLTAMLGAEVINYPTAIGWCANESLAEQGCQLEAWVTMLRSHAIANGVYVCAANRVGVEGNLTFWGHSLVVDPLGEVIARGSGEDREVILAEIDLAKMTYARRTWPFFRDRRVDTFGGLTRRFGR